jgi:hypothetical protein
MGVRAKRLSELAFVRRRGLIGAIAAVAAAPLWMALAGRLASSGDRSEAAARRLIAALPNADSSRRIGAAWLAQRPREGNVGRLLACLRQPGDGFARAVERGESTVLRGALPQRIADDFACGRVVRVEGWLLAETEIRLCALAAVTPGQAGDRAIAG